MSELNVDFPMMVSMMATLLLLMAVGYISRKAGFIDDGSSKWLSNFVICVCQPFMIINAVVSIDYSVENLKMAGIVMALGLAVHAVSAVIAHLSTMRYKNIDERAIVEYGIIFGNCGFMGFPVIKAMLGDTALFWAAFYVIDFNIICWTYGMIVLSRARKEIKINVKNMFLNYGTTPCLVGLILWLTRITLPQPLTATIKYMGDVCTPLSMVIVGSLLAKIPVKKLIADLKVYYACFARLIINPIVVILIGKLIGIEKTHQLGASLLIFVTVMASVPVASNSAMFAERYDLIPAKTAHLVGLSTVVSAVTIPIMIWIESLI